MAFTDNFGYPKGLLGRIMLVSMDKEHLPMAEWGFTQFEMPQKADILDIGCGGGYNIKRMLNRCPEGKVIGLDISEESVKKAKAVNKGEERVEILRASVEKMPFGDDQFDLVTAFETVFFWPDAESNIQEVFRVTKPGGCFAVINNYGDPKIDWEKKIPCMKRFTAERIGEFLEKAGFERLKISKKENLFCVIGQKPGKTAEVNRKPAGLHPSGQKKQDCVMKTAEQLMKKKGFLKAELDKAISKDQSNLMWRASTEKLQAILNQYGELPAGVRSHTDSIFPAAAVYLTVKERFGSEIAYKVIEEAAVNICAAVQPKLEKFVRVPGMASLFVKLWDPMTKKKFSAACGFQNVFYPKKKGEYKMDIIACPYFRFFTELGCPELTKIYCENDERIYGNLPGLKFERTGTLGKGAARCDFYIRKL